MRSDMHKILTERGRRGGNINNKAINYHQSKTKPRNGFYFGKTYDEFLPKQESMRKRYSFAKKEHSDFISPLYRWLEKQCGRDWDSVWSEICITMRGNNVLRKHVKDHIKMAVAGIPFSNTYWHSTERVGEPVYLKYSGQFYVDHNKILRQTPFKNKRMNGAVEKVI